MSDNWLLIFQAVCFIQFIVYIRVGPPLYVKKNPIKICVIICHLFVQPFVFDFTLENIV